MFDRFEELRRDAKLQAYVNNLQFSFECLLSEVTGDLAVPDVPVLQFSFECLCTGLDGGLEGSLLGGRVWDSCLSLLFLVVSSAHPSAYGFGEEGCSDGHEWI